MAKIDNLEIDTIYNEDCLEGMKRIPDGSIDLVVTDPPYRTISGGNKSEKWKSGYSGSVLYKNDGKIFDNNSITPEDYMPELYRVLKENTHAYVMSNLLNLKHIWQVAEDCGFYVHNLLVWEKNTANANRWYMKNCEYTLFMKKGAAKTINNPSSKTVHQFNNPVGTKNHPTEKPVDLMAFYIKNSSKQDDVVLDPFMGSGTTAIACIKEKRHFIGFELDKGYYEKACNRVKLEQAQLSLF